jgi:hypothetical protein
MNETRQKVLDLKAADQDAEYFPTTNEILHCIQNDILQMVKGEDFNFRYGYKENYIRREVADYNTHTYKVHIPSFIDIGAGNGKAIDFMRGDDKNEFYIKEKLGIEIADLQADDLIRRGIGIIGRDFFETVLIDKEFSIVFSNPPYSIFKQWCNKIFSEARATLIYLVIPERWKDDAEFAGRAKKKGELTVIGNFDFLEADRPARAKVDVIRIYNNQCREQKDVFAEWVENNIGRFEVAEELPEESPEAGQSKDITEHNADTVAVLCENYRNDLNEIMEAYLSLAKINFKLLKQLGIDKNSVILKIKGDIEGLKKRYWLKTFDILKPISKRLTWRTREKLLNEINWFSKLDFTPANIKTIVVWCIENYNKYVKEQLLQAFDDFTALDGFTAYKSNTVWHKGTWRYNGKDMPQLYKLDYRIITRCYIDKYEYKRHENILSDLTTIACNLGFENEGVTDFAQDGKQKKCVNKDCEAVFEYRLYQNGNLHVKIKKELIKAWNLEVGKLKNWLHEPEDVAREFDVSMEEATQMWNGSSLQLINKASPLLIGFGGNK